MSLKTNASINLLGNAIYKGFNVFIDLIYPRNCYLCGNELMGKEQSICRKCEYELPQTNFDVIENNPIEQLFWGRLKAEKATSIFFYRKGESLQKILKGMKYLSKTDLCVDMGRIIGRRLKYSNFINDIDCIVPVPLHPNKRRKREYNQSELLCNGIAEVTNIKVDSQWIHRVVDTSTQTRKGRFERYTNVENVFFIREKDKWNGKSILLIDDVITTGSTMEALGNSILESGSDTKLYVASLGYAI